MKKLMFTLLVLFSFTAATHAQIPDIKLGAKAGINLANISGGDNSKLKLGLNAGVLAEIFFTEKFSVQPEILYSAQGRKYTFGSATGFSSIDYINVPIIAKYYLIEGFNVQAGPQVGFLVKESSKAAVDGIEDVKAKTNLCKSIDFGVGLGIGYELPIGVFADARYNLGLTDIFKKELSDKKSHTNQVIQVSLGYKF